MAEEREALIRHYLSARAELQAAIDGLTPEQMVEETLDGWSVKDHLLHIAAWDEMRTLEVERISAGHQSALRMSEAQDAVYNELAYELRRRLSPEQAMWELERTRSRLLDSIRAATQRGLEPEHYGESALVSSHEVEHAGWIRRWRSERGY